MLRLWQYLRNILLIQTDDSCIFSVFKVLFTLQWKPTWPKLLTQIKFFQRPIQSYFQMILIFKWFYNLEQFLKNLPDIRQCFRNDFLLMDTFNTQCAKFWAPRVSREQMMRCTGLYQTQPKQNKIR